MARNASSKRVPSGFDLTNDEWQSPLDHPAMRGSQEPAINASQTLASRAIAAQLPEIYSDLMDHHRGLPKLK